MGLVHGKIYNSVSEITGPTGWYSIRTSEGPCLTYVDQDYDGGGWCWALANRSNTGGMNLLRYNDAINLCNVRTEPSSNQGSNTRLAGPLPTLANCNFWLGLKYWFPLTGRVTSGQCTIVQFVSGTNGTALSATGSHTKRYRWKFDSWNGEYAFVGRGAISDETGTGEPGLYAYHAASTARGLTTWDVDNDENGGNCATYYNNNPFWYGSCWSGNYFAGGGYLDRPYWNSSGSDNHQYGAVYIK